MFGRVASAMEPAPSSAAAASVAGQRLGEIDDAEHNFGEQGSAQRVGSKLSSDNIDKLS